ncbi:Os06g0475800 [Oryza sativa Japonica Group]|uniref:Os06g0475800 protein n=2 Tax=Oryza sativa subsp. japonica TaxID=39947 RepID=A0A0P0WWZ1_ORYSJ|nr:hypothetical protein OsJ_21355 [Oryza sativa Japonica Group]KAB8102499.1 hypothetical protein EE612_034144 [Oryza sativa]KAF2926805.1 hypothetical protein DAI22_06g156300 [Oryza sativa Japonica Group]BAD35295.1 hypothetical protein [Oryza sativa Japonica Group]BAS97775.1 Os06g0475800 [Oryza sativa Japonica Group]
MSVGADFGKELSKLPDGSPASPSIHGDSSGSHSPERLTPSPVMREVDLPPEFRVRGPPMPDWPPPPTESDEERFQEDLEQYYNDGYVSTPCPSPASDLCDSEENLEDEVRKMIIGGMGMCCLRLINKGYSVAAEQAQEGLG